MSVPPVRLGERYEVGELIGRGGMADVHRATDTVLGRDVAVKLLREVTEVDSRRFADEASLLAALDHPHIVSLLDVGVDDDRPWIALELAEGSTLAELMAAGQVPEDVAARIGAEVAGALAHAHERGIVHRDVKPSNIVLTADGSALLTDFGIARLADATAGVTLTGHTVGTAAYLSPEQVRGEPVSGPADVYSLGLVLLEALSGARAYPGPPVEAALARLHRSPLIPTSLPPGWTGLLAAMTAADAADRPSAAQAAERLGSPGSPAYAAGSAPALDGAGEETTTHLIPIPTRRRRRGGLVAVAAGLALIGSLLLARGIGGDEPAAARVAATPTSSRSVPSAERLTTKPVATTAPSPSPSPRPVVATSTAPKPSRHHTRTHRAPTPRHHAAPTHHAKPKPKPKPKHASKPKHHAHPSPKAKHHGKPKAPPGKGHRK